MPRMNTQRHFVFFFLDVSLDLPLGGTWRRGLCRFSEGGNERRPGFEAAFLFVSCAIL